MSKQLGEVIDFGRLALELDQAVSAWASKQDLAGVASTLNRVAMELGITGGAFGVANVEKNTFRLYRALSFDKTQDDSPGQRLFPYAYPADQSAALRLVEMGIEKDYPEWMHRVFGLQRQQQSLEASTGVLSVPEFFKHLKSRISQSGELTNTSALDWVLVPWIDISTVLRQWLDIWMIASMSPTGLATTSELAATLPQATQSQSLYDLIQTVSRLTASVIWAPSRIKKLPEYIFFLHDFEEPESEDAVTAHLLYEIAKQIPVTEIRRIVPDSKDSLAREGETKPLLAKLESLHRTAPFPILPYLILSIIDPGPKHHCVLPLLHSLEFPVRYSIIDGPESQLHSCVMVFLGTLRSKTPTPPDPEHIAALSLLVKRIAEPISEGEFYGGIYRNKLEAMHAGNTFRDFFRSITHELSPLQTRLTHSWLIPLSECFEVVPQALSQGAGRFGSVSINPEVDPAATEKIRVLTAPFIYHAAGDRFGLWTDKGWLGRPHLKLDEPQPFSEVIKVLMRCAAEGRYIEAKHSQVSKQELMSPTTLAAWENSFEQETGSMTELLLRGLETKSLACIEWHPANNSEEEAALHFARLVVAICANSLKNCGDRPIVTEFTFDRVEGSLQVAQTNDCDKPGITKPDGTETAIKFLVQLLEGDREKVQFGRQESKWVTMCRFRAPFLKPME